jgi:hypothetical protein
LCKEKNSVQEKKDFATAGRKLQKKHIKKNLTGTLIARGNQQQKNFAFCINKKKSSAGKFGTILCPMR